MNRILARLFVVNYYKKNTAFFIFMVFVLFGAMSAIEVVDFHTAIMHMVNTSSIGLLVFIMVGAAYAFKCSSFITGQAKRTENQFLLALRQVADGRQATTYAGCAVLVYAPLLAYAGTTMAVGISMHQYLSVAIILAAQVLNMVAITGFTWRAINTNSQHTVWLKLPDYRQPLGPYSFTLRYLWQQKRLNLLGIKAFSMLVFQFLVLLNADNVKKENICFVALLSASAHGLLPYHIIRFWERDLWTVRTFPIPLVKKLSYWLLTYVLLLLPELLFMLVNNPDHLPLLTILSFYTMGITHLLLLTALLYLPRINFNQYSGTVTFLFFACMILLAALPLAIFLLAEVTVAAILLYLFYNGYESKVEESMG